MFVYLNGYVGAHPSTDPACSTFLRFDNGGNQVSLGGELGLGDFKTAAGAKFYAVATSLAQAFIDNYLSFYHNDILPFI